MIRAAQDMGLWNWVKHHGIANVEPKPADNIWAGWVRGWCSEDGEQFSRRARYSVPYNKCPLLLSLLTL